ncbi:MAG: hypothetical protein AAF500_08065 [Myxococcota bacterium]
MPVRQLGRRHFLLGTGGAVLSIPFLHSLAPRTAKAQAPDPKFFVAYLTEHGGVWPEHMYPGDSVLNRSHSLYSGHTMRYGRLVRTTSGSQVRMSSVLTGASGDLPQSLIDKLMVIRGLDVPFYVGHSTAHVLGNYERRDQGPDIASLYVPTIDQVLANWAGFYGSGDPYYLKSMHVGQGLSWIERSAGVQAMSPATSPDALFRTLLSNVSPYDPPVQPPPSPQPPPPAPQPPPPAPQPPPPAPMPPPPAPQPPPPAPMPPPPTPQPPPPAPQPPPPAPMPPPPSPEPPPPAPAPQPPAPMPPGETRTHVLNRVVEHYNGLVNGAFGDARRLSANDKARLTDHMDMVSDLARRFDTSDTTTKALGGGAACDPNAANRGNTTSSMWSPDYSDLRRWHEDYNAVFAAAISCGACRIATVRANNTFHHSPSYAGGDQWHEPVAHRAAFSREKWAQEGNLPEHPQDIITTANANFFRDTFVDLIGRIDEIDAGDGSSLLEQGLVMWAQESGPSTHDSDGIPVITAGSVNGYFNTGHYFDLRNRSGGLMPGSSRENAALHDQRRPGILYAQWLSNVLQAMGMSPSEFTRSHTHGWAGYGYALNDSTTRWPQRLFTDANNKIPKVTSGT